MWFFLLIRNLAISRKSLGNLDMIKIHTHEKCYRNIMRMCGKGYIFVDKDVRIYSFIFCFT